MTQVRVYRYKHIEPPYRTPEKRTVLHACQAGFGDGLHLMPNELPLELSR